jgi:acylpyruvate hydrolase
MKLVVYGPHKRLGSWLEDGSVVDVNHAYAALLESKGEPNSCAKADAEAPSCLLAFIEEGEEGLNAAKKAVDYVKKVKVSAGGEQLVFKGGDVKIHAPLPSAATRIAMAGANFYDHSADVSKMMGRSTTVEEIKKQVHTTPGAYGSWRRTSSAPTRRYRTPPGRSGWTTRSRSAPSSARRVRT